MPLYRCIGLDAGGRQASELFQADDADRLRAELEAHGWSGVQVEAVEARPAGPLLAEELITLGDEIAGMARAGLPLDRALAELARDLHRGRLKQVVEHLAADLRAGVPLDEALRRQEGALPPVFAAVVAAGLRTGRLPEALSTLAQYARTAADLRALVRGALFYPVTVLIFGVALFVAVSLVAGTSWKDAYEDFGVQLPVTSRVALEVAGRPVEYVLVPLACIAAALGLCWLLLRLTPAGRRAQTRLLYSLPLFGMLLRCVRMASFSDMLALLTEHAVPLPEAVALAGRSILDPTLAEACVNVQQDLRAGKSFSEALRNQPAVPDLFTWIVAVAEPRGMLTDALRQLAETYRRRAAARTNLLRSVLPPFLVVVVGGLVVGFFATAFYIPLVQLISLLSGPSGR